MSDQRSLEALIRERQDALRGRPLTWWERFRDRVPSHDRVLDAIMITLFYVNLAFVGVLLLTLAWAAWVTFS
jgi:hypothetical protein